jgi:aerobic-type carbon monoxide dehydrogenase small subunit (CoxS/CutS family)
MVAKERQSVTTFKHNQSTHTLEAAPNGFLLHILRGPCADASVRLGCGSGHCGACTVLVDGLAENACTLPVWSAEGRHVQTAAGLPEDRLGRIVLQAFIDEQAAQCGYCISGILMRVTGLLQQQPNADDSQIKEALLRHLCRCGAHARILRAVKLAQKNIQHDSTLA